ncbi:hypothetical protein [Bacillus cereus]|uniref:hypothetical protein n=1 Tax=Bacillus cereus TaxID=1396 RepID=UPI001FD033D8|nr:hypothetical protein [Bacillus cereus]
MVDSYSIEIKDVDNKTYLLCEEGSNEVLTFATYEEPPITTTNLKIHYPTD